VCHVCMLCVKHTGWLLSHNTHISHIHYKCITHTWLWLVMCVQSSHTHYNKHYNTHTQYCEYYFGSFQVHSEIIHANYCKNKRWSIILNVLQHDDTLHTYTTHIHTINYNTNDEHSSIWMLVGVKVKFRCVGHLYYHYAYQSTCIQLMSL